MRRPALPRSSLLLSGLILAGCVTTNVVIVDRKTSLEQQAAGSYPSLARELEESGVQPGPVPLTREQIAGGASAANAQAADAEEPSDSARLDALLVHRCVGESLDGTLVETKDTCTGDPDIVEVSRLVGRGNRSREQAWTYLTKKVPGAKPETVRAAWRTTRLRELVCGAQIQVAGGKWEVKKC